MKPLFIKHLCTEYPQLNQNQLDELVSENLISPFKLKLSKTILEQAKLVVKNCYALRENEDYQLDVLSKLDPSIARDPKNKSICMSYDFHVNEEEQLKLIEINTNAAFLLLGYNLYKATNTPLPINDFSDLEIIENIKEELRLAQISSTPEIAIIDEDPEQQRLYVEFLVFDTLFKKHGLFSQILNLDSSLKEKFEDHLKNFNKSFNFIYNRSTDFLFSSEKSKFLRECISNSEIVISPHPREYSLLADKSRLIEWTNPLSPWYNKLSEIQKNLLKSTVLDNFVSTEVWSQRKKLFFKPLQSFGSKMSFRGESISRKLLDDIVSKEKILAQEYCPPPEMEFKIDNETIKLKYDLRFYAYKDRVQMCIARLYQGQVTNLKSKHGGFACVEFL